MESLFEYERGFVSDNWFIISDTHFGHSNIIKYCNRPYKDVHEMNNALIINWNSVVSDNDIVIHCGDIGFGKDQFMEMVNQLNGYKIVIKGNHDRPKQIAKMLDIGAINEYYSDDFVLLDKTGDVIISHRPVNPKLFPNELTINLHGHIHNHELEEFTDFKGNYRNVSCEVINYTPSRLDNYVRIIK